MKTRRLGLLILFVSGLLTILGLLLKPDLNAYASEWINATHNSRINYIPAANDSRFTALRYTTSISFTPAYTAYLPLISLPPVGIYGRITYQGLPVTNTQVELWRCDYQGTYWQCSSLNRQFTSTDQAGRYQFTAAPSLQANQQYQVEFYGNDSRYLSWWDSFSIYTYTAGQMMAGGDFDIADVTLLSPDNAITVTLPLKFEWAPRLATPADSYQVGLVNYDTGDHWYSAQLGYASSYTLTTPPPGFTSGVQYAWGIWVTSPAGGSGLSRQGRTFTVGSGSVH